MPNSDFGALLDDAELKSWLVELPKSEFPKFEEKRLVVGWFVGVGWLNKFGVLELPRFENKFGF